MSESDVVVVLTALNLEYQAVRRHLSGIRKQRHSAGTRFEVGTVHGTGCRIALGLTGAGNSASAVLAERAIQEFSPAAVLFVGVAGALRSSLRLGDVVVADRVYAYHGGTSEDDGLKARPRVWEASHPLSQLAKDLARDKDWMRRLPPESGAPQVRFGSIAAGEVLQNSRRSPEAAWIHNSYNDAIAIEMEAGGVAQAGHLHNTHVGIVRGISDRADGTKNPREDLTRQPLAAANAAAFAVTLAAHYLDERTENTMSTPDAGRATPETAGGPVFNVSSGTVGIQAAHVSGSTVSINATPVAGTLDELLKVVSALRDRLDRDHANGEIDDDSYVAARDEIANAENGLRVPDGEGRKKSVLALKRLSGLVAGTTNIAGDVAQVISAVNGLS
ncbi:nucleoside phosphorylase [Stackebrandtia albiflava]|uniref:Nucleoside phosphorylase n=1 Tax=Stackebrandtia albiflava TaxID=406432 RepID=A0A562ULG7_9ACTN|nr:5'-methylthioadenosine/S-adenosylhomocysteine nucleosidase [Stackebrandtia albiflava]TWJ06463.1 nucleoside phosphorylase [Stackebrandtia albiflava]